MLINFMLKKSITNNDDNKHNGFHRPLIQPANSHSEVMTVWWYINLIIIIIIIKQINTWHCGGPQDTAIISLAIFFSFKRTASSMAISSKGFMLCFTPSVTTPVLSGFTRTYSKIYNCNMHYSTPTQICLLKTASVWNSPLWLLHLSK